MIQVNGSTTITVIEDGEMVSPPRTEMPESSEPTVLVLDGSSEDYELSDDDGNTVLIHKDTQVEHSLDGVDSIQFNDAPPYSITRAGDPGTTALARGTTLPVRFISPDQPHLFPGTPALDQGNQIIIGGSSDSDIVAFDMTLHEFNQQYSITENDDGTYTITDKAFDSPNGNIGPKVIVKDVENLNFKPEPHFHNPNTYPTYSIDEVINIQETHYSDDGLNTPDGGNLIFTLGSTEIRIVGGNEEQREILQDTFQELYDNDPDFAREVDKKADDFIGVSIDHLPTNGASYSMGLAYINSSLMKIDPDHINGTIGEGRLAETVAHELLHLNGHRHDDYVYGSEDPHFQAHVLELIDFS